MFPLLFPSTPDDEFCDYIMLFSFDCNYVVHLRRWKYEYEVTVRDCISVRVYFKDLCACFIFEFSSV